MILYELHCSADHGFEAWFKDGAAYDRQAEAGEIVCPVCGDTRVAKALMAPRLAKGRADGEGAVAEPDGEAVRMREALMQLRRHVEANCDYVGNRFAEEARRIHYGETGHRNIYGEATDDQARELSDEGIKVGRVPWLPRTDS